MIFCKCLSFNSKDDLNARLLFGFIMNTLHMIAIVRIKQAVDNTCLSVLNVPGYFPLFVTLALLQVQAQKNIIDFARAG